MSQQIYTVDLFEAEVIAAGQSATSDIVEVNSIRPLGQFASQLLIAGDGVIDIELFVSINGTSFVPYEKLFEGYTAGEYLEPHSLAICLKFYAVATETGGIDSATVSQWMGVQ